MKKTNLKDLDNITKILLILLIGTILYFAMFLILKPFFVREPASMADVMRQMMGSNSSSSTINLISLILAVSVALIISFYLVKFFCDCTEKTYYKILLGKLGKMRVG